MPDHHLWRLSVELHARLYHDIGVEVEPGTWSIRTPYCLQGSRDLGTLASLAPPLLSQAWDDYVTTAFTALDVESWVTTRHLGCFHRRSRACYDLVFNVAALMAGADSRLRVRLTNSATVTVVGQVDGPLDRPSRVLRVDLDGRCVAALHSDGRAVTAERGVDLRCRWRQGASTAVLAAEILEASCNTTQSVK